MDNDAAPTGTAPTAPSPSAPAPAPGQGPGRLDRALAAGLTGLIVLGLPLVALAAIARGVAPTPAALLVGALIYLLACLGITAGYHRLFTHRGYLAARWLARSLALCGGMAVQGSLAGWVADHRVHHRRSDHTGDPHSPWIRLDGSPRRTPGLVGLWHAHAGWLFRPTANDERTLAADILDDPVLVRISRAWPVVALASTLGPAALTWPLAGGRAALAMLVWAGLVRVVLLHHVTWSVNSICHRFGQRPYAAGDHSTNNRWLALLSLGESWHNAHHAFPRSMRHGLGRGQLDVTARCIEIWAALGWASELNQPSTARLASARRAPEPSGEPGR
jgi:stearoyl-CoA desaturase (delta-9 desaturase)